MITGRKKKKRHEGVGQKTPRKWFKNKSMKKKTIPSQPRTKLVHLRGALFQINGWGWGGGGIRAKKLSRATTRII